VYLIPNSVVNLLFCKENAVLGGMGPNGKLMIIGASD
jgi:hypothetical protein